jgi:hypothetical protein
MPKKQPRLTKKERKALSPNPSASPRIIRREGGTYRTSGNVSEEALEAAEAYFAEKERHGGPAQQMMDFVEPLMERAREEGLEAMNRVMTLGMVFWNLALLHGEAREEALTKAEERITGTDEDRATFREAATAMIARHEAMFPWLHGRGQQ